MKKKPVFEVTLTPIQFNEARQRIEPCVPDAMPERQIKKLNRDFRAGRLSVGVKKKGGLKNVQTSSTC